MYFDIRQGAHSIGSGVRDAASYVLWSLARAQDLNALAPHASVLSQKLITVALFDREVHIRRAASASFQEYVGRTVSSNFLHQCSSRTGDLGSLPSRHRCHPKDRLLRRWKKASCVLSCCKRSRRVRPDGIFSNPRKFTDGRWRRHEEYRPALIDHLLSVTLRHWDPAMRKLGAQSLASISQLDPSVLLQSSAKRVVSCGLTELSVSTRLMDYIGSIFDLS